MTACGLVAKPIDSLCEQVDRFGLFGDHGSKRCDHVGDVVVVGGPVDLVEGSVDANERGPDSVHPQNGKSSDGGAQ